MQHIQRGIPAAEIIHQQREAVFPESLHHFPDFFGVFAHGRFGNLNFQRVFGKMVLLHKGTDKGRYIKGKNINCRYIYGNRDQRQASGLTALNPFTDLFPDKLVQIRNKTVLFQNRHKYGRRNHRPILFDPPGQRFGSHNLCRCGPALGLEVKRDFGFFQGILEIRQDPVIRSYRRIHGRIKITYALFKILFRITHGNAGLITQAHRVVFIF